MAPTTRHGATGRRGARPEHGIMTPEGTPAPDQGRLDADKERQAQEQAKLATIAENTQENELSTQSKPELDMNSDGSTGDKGDHEQPSSQPYQDETVTRVLACDENNYRDILGVEPSNPDSRADEENIMNNFRKLGCQTHPDYNNAPGAEKAFKMVLKAAKNLGVESDDIKEIKFWDGEEEFEELRLTSDNQWVSANSEMEVEINPSDFHREIWEQARTLLEQLCLHPDNAEIKGQLNALNDKIIKANRENDFPEDKLSLFTIDVGSFSTIFASAAPYRKRLQKSHADEEAKRQFQQLNDQLAIFNKQHQYPSRWIMDMPEEVAPENPQPSTTPPARTSAPASTANKPGFRRYARKLGHVRDNGTDKKIVGAVRAGFGYHLVLSHPGENGLTIYELVPASQFGKGFGKSYSESPEGTMIKFGNAGDLENKKLSDMAIAGVASVRRLPENEPKGGWCCEAKTIVLVGFSEDLLEFKWYTRTVLGQRFGQKVVDEEINGYRSDAGQERPPAPVSRRQRAPASRKTSADEESSGIDNIGETSKEMEAMMKKMKELENAIARMTSHTARH